MPWRLISPDGYARYNVVCAECGRLRGWESRKRVEQQIADLADAGFVLTGSRVEQFAIGDDDTCTCVVEVPPGTVPPTG